MPVKSGYNRIMYFDLLNAISYLDGPDNLVALPVLNAYMLATRPYQEQALKRLRRISGQSGPLLLLGRDREALSVFTTEFSPFTDQLMQKYWPGALVMALPARPESPALLRDADMQIPVLQPKSSLLLSLLSLLPEGVLAVAEAKRPADKYAACTATAVYNTFGDDVAYVLPGDHLITAEQPPTVISVTADNKIQLLKQGCIVLD
jgi:tRNA A37 threonylcarbamoyladenosine synthetase subunit TsaC/SUA5/YrdC